MEKLRQKRRIGTTENEMAQFSDSLLRGVVHLTSVTVPTVGNVA